MSEKIGGAKGTELDVEFNEMERVCLLCYVFEYNYIIHLYNIYASHKLIFKWILNLSGQITKFSLLKL